MKEYLEYNEHGDEVYTVNGEVVAEIINGAAGPYKIDRNSIVKTVKYIHNMGGYTWVNVSSHDEALDIVADVINKYPTIKAQQKSIGEYLSSKEGRWGVD